MRENRSVSNRPKTLEVFHQFLAAVNTHDAVAIGNLLSADHLFVDALGNPVHGGKTMEHGWRGYLAMCPDYWIRAEHVLAEGEIVLAAGEAGGTIDGRPWRTPAAWKAVVRDGRLVEWRVFADNKPVYEILAHRPKQ